MDALVVVGGDGMVHLGVNATAGTGVPLGIVAVGTGNDFAHALDLPTGRPDRCVDALLAALGPAASAGATVRVVDAARVAGEHVPVARWYAGVLSAGIDAAVNAHANAATWPRGRSRYARSALTEITRYRPYGYRLTVRGVPAGDDVPDVLAEAPLLPLPDAAQHPDAAGGPDGRAFVWESPGALVAVANSPASAAGSGSRLAPCPTTVCWTSSSRARSGGGAPRASSRHVRGPSPRAPCGRDRAGDVGHGRGDRRGSRAAARVRRRGAPRRCRCGSTSSPRALRVLDATVPAR